MITISGLAETVNGYYKAELIRGPARAEQGPGKSVEDVELATLSWAHWHNTARLHGYLDDLPPAEYVQAHYAARQDPGHTRPSPEPDEGCGGLARMALQGGRR